MNGSLLSGHILLFSCPLVLILLEIQSNGDLRLSNFSGTRQSPLLPGWDSQCQELFQRACSPLLRSSGQKLLPILKPLLKHMGHRPWNSLWGVSLVSWGKACV